MNMNRVFSRFVLFSIALVAVMPAFSGVAMAQTQRPAAPPARRPAQAPGWNGDWVNVDPKTRDLVGITLAGMNVHPFGACSPKPCDWGVLTAKASTVQVGTQKQAAMVAVRTTSFERDTLTISLNPDGRLRVDVFTHFTDKSGRKDYRAVNTMARSTAR